MIYRIEYAKGCCKFANSSKDLIKCLDVLEGMHITDIRKLYKMVYQILCWKRMGNISEDDKAGVLQQY